MIKYRLKKDLPFAKAGEIFREDYDKNDDNIVYLYQESYGIKQHKICLEDIDNFDDWFEEVEEAKIPDEFYIPVVYSDKRKIEAIKVNDMVSLSSILQTIFLNNSEIGLAFKSKEEAERCIEYLKAKAIIKQDAKGFEPDWVDDNERKYYGYWFFDDNTADCDYTYLAKNSEIYFRTREDIEESFKKHPDEWETYLTYE